MPEPNDTFGLEQVAAAFPFHLVLDRELTVRAVGPSLQKLLPDVQPGASIVEHLRIERPQIPFDFAAVLGQRQSVFILETPDGRVRLRGQMLADQDRQVLWFLCTPWITEGKDIASLGLSLSDFSTHDPLPDFLFLLHSKNLALDDALKLTDKLRQQKSELAATEAQLRGIVDHAADGIITADESGIVLSFNAAAGRIFGYEAAEVVGRNVSMLMPSPDRERHDAYIARYLQSGTPRIIGTGREVDGLRRDGTRFPLHLSVSEVALESGRIFTGIVQDLSERKRAEQALQESEERARLIVDAALDAVVSIGADGVITAWNARAEAIFGWANSEVLGRKLEETIIPPQHRQAHERGLRHFLATGEGPVLNRRFETTALHRDGHEFPIELAIAPLKVGGSVMFSAFLRDITDRRRREQELREAKESAEQANHTKSRFVASVSHEIRTPMNGVLGMTRLLLDSQLTPVQRNYAEKVKQSGELLLRIINDVLDFSKVEAGKLEFEARPFNPRGLVRTAMGLLEGVAKRKGIELRCSLDETLPVRLIGDPDRLQQVLNNLLANAVKFTSHGSVVAGAAVADRDAEEVTLRFAVEDTGPGIPATELNRIFEPFVQADSSSTREFEGTGLGLAICRHIVDRLGGQLGVDSEVGRGSTFWFTARFRVPDQAANLLAGAGQETVPIYPVRPQSPVSPLRILVAEDNEINRELLTAMLEQAGHQVSAVTNGLEAVEAFARNAFDVVLMDCQMPEMDGCDATRAIRARGANGPRVPVIGVTANAFKGDREACLAAGMDDHLAKPLDPNELAAALARWARKSIATARPAIDGQTLQKLRDIDVRGGRNLMEQLVRMFLDQVPDRIATIRKALASRDANSIARAAHDLKGSSGNLGALQLSRLCADIQERARTGRLDGIGPLIEAVAAEFQRAKTELQRQQEDHTIAAGR